VEKDVPEKTKSPHLNLLRNQIDITRVPFSDRGSRLMVFQEPGKSSLHLKLAERLAKLQPDIEAYRIRPPFIRELSLIDGEGEPLDFEVETYPHQLCFQTRIGEFGLVFQDRRTLAFGLPGQVEAGLRFYVEPQYWKETEHGGTFKSVRNLTYTSNEAFVHNRIVPTTGGYTVECIAHASDDCVIGLTVDEHIDTSFEMLPFSVARSAAEARWHAWFDRVPPVDERYRLTYMYAWWIMATNLISPQGNVAYEAMTPSKISYIGLWLWDSAMHALAYRHVDPELARNQILAMLAFQLPDGMLPDAIYDEGVIAMIDHPFVAEVTKPPILAWAALKLHETAPDPVFLEEIYIPMVRWNAWWFAMNDDNLDGLVQYNHPYSSGLDDSPLWDYSMPVESPDINTYLCVQMGSLAIMAEALGMDAEARMWRRRAAAIVGRMIEQFWDEEAGLFWALQENKEPVRVVTPFSLYPLWTGQLPDHIRGRLIAHLTNPDEFWGEHVIPTVSRSDPHFDPATMWRGPVWVNVNYFFIEALQQIGEYDLANTLCEKTLDLVMGKAGIYEYYNADTGQPPATAAETFGWTAAVFIDLAIRASQREGMKTDDGRE
jgi:putative isomerase